MTTENVAPAVAPEAVPAVTTTTSVEVVAPIDSLVPEDLSAAPVAPVVADPVVPPPVVEDKVSDWFLYDGVKGVGDLPAWYKADRYKTVAAQAEAYAHLEKRMGAFVGAPKDGKYEVPPLPEGIEGEFQVDHPLFEQASKWAAENQFSQPAFNQMMGMLMQYEASQAPDLAEEKVAIGADADKRINEVSLWAKANLSPEQFAAYRGAMGQRGAAQVFTAIEAVVGKTRQPALPKPGDLGTGDEPVSPLAEINALQAKVDPKTGKRFYEADAAFRDMVEKKRTAYFQAAQQN